MANRNRFAILDGVEEDGVFEVDGTLKPGGNAMGKDAKGGLVLKDRDAIGMRKFEVDQTVKKLVLSPVRTDDLVVMYPPVPIDSVRKAKKFSHRHLTSFRTKDGDARVVHGTFGVGGRLEI